MPGEAKKVNRYDGVLLVKKPLGKSSHDVVQVVRRTVHQRQVGHAGTLDPLAEGLLVTCLGRATKVVRFLSHQDKTYEAEIFLGLSSRTMDREGVDRHSVPVAPPDIDDEEMQGVLNKFSGRITQTVPAYSAIRVDGEPLYKKARRGEEVAPPSREVEISNIRLLDYRKPFLNIRVSCSSGTYIRTLADDIGRELGCGAYLSQLIRTRVGKMELNRALTLDQVEELHDGGKLGDHLLGYESVLDFSAIVVTDDFRPFVIQGRPVRGESVERCDGTFSRGDNVLLKSRDGEILAVGTAGVDQARIYDAENENVFSYIRVLN